jgi:hypothetical protein
MGLDMYLYANQFICGGDWTPNEEKNKRNSIAALFPEIKRTGNLDSVEVSFEVGYWRKANAIHKWFVDHCQDGIDDCRQTYVERSDLQELKKVCQKVLTNSLNVKALPTQEGFFFGSTEYDEYYYEDMKRTIDIIDYCLSLPEKFSFEYHSSW